jgi:lipoprotein-releasing system permease protein
LIRSSSYIDGAVLRGIENSSKPSGIVDKIVEGKFDFDSNTSKEIVIGRDLAKKLNVSVGNKVMLIVMSKDSAIRNFSPDIEEFNVKGVYHTGMTLYDETVVFMPSGTATEFFHQMPGSASYLEIMLDDINKSPVISKAIMDDFGYPYYATTIFERHAAMFAWIDLQKEPIPIVLGLITIVAVFNIITILLITIVEKTHSVGILRALGMPSGQLLKIFVIQGLILGVIGTIIGCLLGFSFFYIQDVYKLIHLKGEIYYLDTLPVAFSAWHYVIVGGFSILLSFLASIVPASISLRISPIKAIRFK